MEIALKMKCLDLNNQNLFDFLIDLESLDMSKQMFDFAQKLGGKTPTEPKTPTVALPKIKQNVVSFTLIFLASRSLRMSASSKVEKTRSWAFERSLELSNWCQTAEVML